MYKILPSSTNFNLITYTLSMQKQFNVFFLITSVVSFTVIALRNYFVPFNHDETASFFMYIQSGNYIPFYSIADANNHVLNSFLSNICFHLFGSSPFALRLPNLFGFLVLVYATYKLSKSLQKTGSKVFLTIALLFSFHWLSFFSTCRGYGISMALLILGIATLVDYINNTSKTKSFILCFVCFQLAVSANLILIIVVLLLSGIVMLVQLFNNKLFKLTTLLIWLLHFAAVYYWLSFSFYLQDKGALYYGEADSYWKRTFVSLIQLITGYGNAIVCYTILALFIAVILLSFYLNKNNLLNIIGQFKKPSLSLLFASVLCLLISAFYAMNKLKGINYPEDRTGLFFYLFFVLLVSFTIDKFSVKANTIILYPVSLFIAIHFFYNLNFREHSLYVYETIPQHFYTTLVNEQKKSEEHITIGGHRVRELFFGFMNYRNSGYLNPADPTETMQMNCDYYIARKEVDKNYQNYYDVIDTEPDWGFMVLKRKEKIKRILLAEVQDKNVDTQDGEFMEVYRSTDTSSASVNPLLAELTFDVGQIPVPNNVWMVFQVNDSANQTSSYKRYPLYWSGDDLNGRKSLICGLTSGNLPKGKKNIVCYFWNIKKEPFKIQVHSFKLYRLEGNGVDYVAPEIK